MGDRIKGLPEVQVDNIHCSPLIYQARHFIIEAWGTTHGRQSSMKFSNVGPSHGLQFFMNCSSMGPSHRLQSFRTGLLQHGSLTGHRSCQKTCSSVDSSPQGCSSCQEPAPARALHGVTTSFRACPPALAWGPPRDAVWISAPLGSSTVFTVGCRGISSPAPGAPPPPPSSVTLAEQPQLSQPVLIGEVFQPSDHFCGPPLDPLQQACVFLVLGTPELDAVLQVGSHQSRVGGQNHLPRPAGHASFDAAQDTIGFLGCEYTLLAHVQLFIHQYPQVLLCRAVLNPFIPQSVLIMGIALTQVQALALGLVELHEGHMGPLLKPVQVPLDGIPSLQQINCTTQLGVIHKLAEGVLNLLYGSSKID
ncbi:hypothetical protein QYF61_013359 [Mycteria americana]|uniref:Uncharacterized protein n=1 Tax=Mycteria americana TaxID=33587 RepID=A0AAN7NGI8_MYCAM|nr:hypothetical protein QYF61_013359 [Mycteria americana]